ncbi:MAG TPA: C-terminal binding protein [Planctomycetota bacterium]|nr:C-terminal binding protein [Planctomycetota bacterium]
MPLAVITDHTFAEVDLERAAIEAAGARCESRKQASGAELVALVAEADAVITQFARIDATVIGAMKRCRVIARYGIGVDNVDLDAAKARGIPVCNVPDYCIDEVADHALSMALSLTRRLGENSAAIRAGEWRLAVPVTAMSAMATLTVGVVGFGRIGREVAARLRAFKAKVLVHDPFAPAAAIVAAGCVPATLDELLAQSDLLTLHCPSMPSTRKLLNAGTLARCKRGVLIVNVGRGDLIDTPALVAALEGGRVGAAALDVADTEPLPAGHALARLPQVLMTSHIASVSPRAVQALREGTVAAAVRALTGKPAVNVVNGVAIATQGAR